MGKFVIKEVNTGIKFDLVAVNGEVIGTSEVYETKISCLNGIDSVQRNSAVAEVEDQTHSEYETKTNPKFEIYTDKAGEYRFRLKAKNGQNILASEGYTTKQACENGIISVIRNAVDAKIVEAQTV